MLHRHMNLSAPGHQIQTGPPAGSGVCVDGCVGLFVGEQMKKMCVHASLSRSVCMHLCVLAHRSFAIHHTAEGCYRNTFPQPHGY